MTTTVLEPPATEVAPRVSLRRLAPAFAAWATGAAVYLLVTAYHYRALAIPVRPAKLFFEDWLVWDTGHYLDIATGGYTPFDQYAFFPLYPLILRGTDYLPGGVRVAGPIVTMLIALAAIVVIQLLTEREFGRDTARRTVFYVVAFPTAFFLFAPYNEGLFVLLAATALYAARKQAWWLAGLAGGLAGATRTFGLLLLLPLAYEYVRQYHRPRWSALWLLLVPAGLGGYMLYSWGSAGDALAFAHAQNSWHRAYAWPLEPQWHAVRLLGDQPLLSAYSLLYVQQLALFALAATALVLCVAGPWRLRRDQGYLLVYALALFLPLLVTEVGPQDPLGSIHRFLLEIIPIFMILGRVGRRELLDRFLLLGMLALNVINMLTFLTKNTFVA